MMARSRLAHICLGGHQLQSGLRVAMVAPRYSPFIGGVETHVEELTRTLLGFGLEVDVWTHQTSPPLASLLGESPRVYRFQTTVSAPNYEISVPLWRELRKKQ